MASNIKNYKCLIVNNETQRGSILSEYLTYSKLHEMVTQKFNLEANAVIKLSFKLSSFDSVVDITDDAEVQFFVECACNSDDEFAHLSNEYNTDDVVTENPQDKIYKWQKFMSFEPDIPETPVYKAKQNISNQYSQQSEVEKGKIFDNKESLIMAVRLKALSEELVLKDGTTGRIGPQSAYNYMTSNSVESVNACSVIYRKEPVLKLAETYRAMVQECKYDVRNNRLGSAQSGKKKMKSATWVVKGVNAYQYEVSDGQYIREVNLQTGICGCRKWQLSGLPCGHVIAITRFLGLTDCVHYVVDWFKKPKYQATYSESIHSLGNMQQWEFPENIQKAIPPRMDNPQPGRPKNTKRQVYVTTSTDAIQERDTILMYTHHNSLHVYVSRVELSPLVVAELFRDETNKRENQGKPSCAKKLFD
ncbi:transposase, MuDR, MULE transposase domain protein [Tanacetum coccineum]